MLTRVLFFVVLLLVGGLLLARFIRPRPRTEPPVAGGRPAAGVRAGSGTVAWRVGGLVLGAALGARLAVAPNQWALAAGPVFGAFALAGVFAGELRRGVPGRPVPRAGLPVAVLVGLVALVLAVQPGCARSWQFAVGAAVLVGAVLAVLVARRVAGTPGAVQVVASAAALFVAACLASSAYATGTALRTGSCHGVPAFGWPLTVVGAASALAAAWFTATLLIPRVRV